MAQGIGPEFKTQYYKKKVGTQKHIPMYNVHSSIIHNSQKLEATQGLLVNE
jgi:hypothetical protein